jgi:hypothetical protein
MEDPSNATSGKHQSTAQNDQDDPPSKRHKASMFDTPGCPTAVSVAMNKLAKLVENHPRLHSKLEEMLEDLLDELEPEISADIQKEKNEDSCPLYKVSNDEFKHIFGYVGEKQYGFVAGVSDRFHQVYVDTFQGETTTSMESAVASVSCAKLYLDMGSPDCDTRLTQLFEAAASYGKMEVLKWGQDSGYELDDLLGREEIADAALNGHLGVVKYLRLLGIEWDKRTCENAAKNGHLELLKWTRANQCPWDALTCSAAAKNGHLELLKWARLNQCRWDGMDMRLCCHEWPP